MNTKKIANFFKLVILIGVGLAVALDVCYADYKEKNGGDANTPERLIVMAAEYPAVEVAPGEDVSIDLIFHNKGRTDETVDLRLAKTPQDWNVRLKTYRYTVMGVSVASGESKTLTFEADPDETVKPGNYEFRVEAKTVDGRFKMAQDITVRVKADAKGAKKSKGVKLTTSYPVLRGPSDAKFEFSVEVDSKLDKDTVFDLFAQGPKDWNINFKPAYETKYISSIRLKANASKTVAVEVKPSEQTPAGEYPVIVRVSAGEAKAEAKLAVTLTGTYDLEVGTPNGLLSLDARQGKPANMSIYVKNDGTAANHNIKFLSFKPENWKVDFKPETIDVIEPGALKQVEAIMTPNEEALVGDYSVSVSVEGEKTKKPIEFRVTVNSSAAWGWIGIGIILAVVLGLTGLFRWVGRR
jgi:uncharacterized membrane protein